MGNVEFREENGVTNIILMKKGMVRSLILFNLNENEQKMIKSGIVLRMQRTCYQ